MANCCVCNKPNGRIEIFDHVSICDACAAPFAQKYRLMLVQKNAANTKSYYDDVVNEIKYSKNYNLTQITLLTQAVTERAEQRMEEFHDEAPIEITNSQNATAPEPAPHTEPAPRSVIAASSGSGGFATAMGAITIALGIIGAFILAFTFGRNRRGDIQFLPFIGILIGSSFGSLLIGSIAIGVGDIQKRLKSIEDRLGEKK